MMTLRIVDAHEAPTLAPAEDSDAPTASGDPSAGAVLDIGPLRQAVMARGGVSAHVSEADARAFYRARKVGFVTPDEADRLALGLLGQHPSAIWGQAWWAACAPDEDDDLEDEA